MPNRSVIPALAGSRCPTEAQSRREKIAAELAFRASSVYIRVWQAAQKEQQEDVGSHRLDCSAKRSSAKRALLPVVGVQKDIRYYGSPAKSILNGPEVTGMGLLVDQSVRRLRIRMCLLLRPICTPIRDGARFRRRQNGRTHSAKLSRSCRRGSRSSATSSSSTTRRKYSSKTLRHGSDKHLALLDGEAIVIGTATDPYQPAERRFRVTRRILEVIAEHPGLTVCMISKSPLITRDIDVLSRIARISDLTIHISLITLNRELARRLEPRAPTPEARVRALTRLREAGIDAGINCMPVLPGITDNPSDLEALVKRVAEAGATYVGACALRLQSAARKRYLPFIEQEFPHLAERYRNTYAHGYQAGDRYRAGLSAFFDKLCKKYGVPSLVESRG